MAKQVSPILNRQPIHSRIHNEAGRNIVKRDDSPDTTPPATNSRVGHSSRRSPSGGREERGSRSPVATRRSVQERVEARPSDVLMGAATQPIRKATVDLFANQLNHQLPRYGSPHHDVNALLVDSLHSQWPQAEILYAFLPANLLPQVLDKIREEQDVFVILIAPTTPTTTWYPTLKRVAQTCERLPASLQLQQPHCDLVHPDSSSMRLAMWGICGRDF